MSPTSFGYRVHSGRFLRFIVDDTLVCCDARRETSADAIRALRAEFGESQQRFSDRIGVVVRTVARYEVQKPPTGDMLAKLAALAEEVGRSDLRVVFTNAFWRELNEEIERKLQIEVPRLHSHYKALLWLTLNGGHRSQARVDNFFKEEITRVAKERKRELTDEEQQNLGSLAGSVQ